MTTVFRDPRDYQVSVLMLLLLYGSFFLNFEMLPGIIGVILFTAQLSQYLFTRYVRLPAFDPRSALISSLSLCLLLRTDSLLFAALAAFLAIASKFLFRSRNKHIFNPTNFALVVLLLSTDAVWVSSGQWGQFAYFALLIACMGLIVIHRSRRSDVTLAFLGFYTLMIFSRALWLGDPMPVPWHQLQSGALLIFAFFMISDPVTTPNSRPGRIVFAALVAGGAGFIQFVLYQPNAVLYSLVGFCLIVPLLDRIFPAEKFQWKTLTSKTLKIPRSEALSIRRTS